MDEMKAGTKATRDYIHKLFNIAEITPNLFRANYLVSPSGRTGSAYGGLLFAQSLAAAEFTVNKNVFTPHSIHSYFILNVRTDESVDYRIQRVRDGRSYSTRIVTAEQDSKVVMSSQVSFCVKEESSIEHQSARMPQVPEPENLVNSVDFCRSHLDEYEKGKIEFPTKTIEQFRNKLKAADDDLFEIRMCEPKKYYGLEKFSVEPLHFWMKTYCDLNNDRDEHRLVAAYISDATLVSVANRPHASNGYVPSMLYSLDHVVRFHNDEFRADEWMLYENWSPWAGSYIFASLILGNGRALSEGRLWTRDGRLILSASQESLSRTRGQKSSL